MDVGQRDVGLLALRPFFHNLLCDSGPETLETTFPNGFCQLPIRSIIQKH
jgi:hypothetical protein